MYKKRIERLGEIVSEGLDYYNRDPRRAYGNTTYFRDNYTRQQRLAFITTLVGEIEKLPLQESETGFYGFGEITNEQRNMLKYIALDLSAKTLRGYLTGYTLKGKDFPFINKWNPLVMYLLSKKHGIPYEKFAIPSQHAQYLLGRDLKELTIRVQEYDIYNLYNGGSYLISSSGYIIKDERHEPNRGNREEVTDDDEDRADYSKCNFRILRRYSPYIITLNDDYTKGYENIPDEYKLSKKYMQDLVLNYGIINKRKVEKLPEGYEF